MEYNEYVFNIYFECVGKQENNPFTVITEKEDE